MFLLLSLFLQVTFFIFMFGLANNFTTKILGGTATILAFIFAICINNTNLHHDTKLAYIIFLVLFPIYGIITFLLSVLTQGSIKYKKYIQKLKLVNKSLEQNTNTYAKLTGKEKSIATYLYDSCGFPVYENTNCYYYKSGKELFEAMLEEITKAKQFIFLEYYIISYGKLLSKLIPLLEEKLKNGVEVRLMYDGTSSIAKIPHSFCKKMNKLGIKCKMFMPVRAILSSEQNNRDHRKICVIDNKVAFTGGLNLADEYINEKHPLGYWKDVGIKLEGEAVTTYTTMFLKMWNFKNKKIEDFSKYTNHKHTIESNGIFIPFGDHPHDNEDVSKNTILHLLSNARETVCITTPYLILDDELKNAFCNCSKKGVEIKIITPHIADKKIIYAVTQTNYKPLLDAGIKIYRYLPGFIHAKSMIVDNMHALVGTVNLDYRSLYLNFENSVYICNCSEINEMSKDFQQSVNESLLITKQKYKKINIFTKIIGKILKIFTPLM